MPESTGPGLNTRTDDSGGSPGLRAILIIHSHSPSRRAPSEPRGPGRRWKALADAAPDLLNEALARGEDFILATETDEETGTRTLYIMTGRFVTTCMLRKLIGVAESQQDEGAVLLTE